MWIIDAGARSGGPALAGRRLVTMPLENTADGCRRNADRASSNGDAEAQAPIVENPSKL